MSSSKVQEKTFTLRSKDGKVFSIKESVAVQCGMIEKLVESGSATNTIPVDKVYGSTLNSVLEYLNMHADSAISDEDKDKFDSDFFKRPANELIQIIVAAHNLGTYGLRDFVAEVLADHIKEMTVEEVRGVFKIKNDFTPEEEAEIRETHAWAFL